MPVEIRCPYCSTGATVPDDLVGKTVRCKKCEYSFPVKAVARPAKAADTAAPVRPARPAARVVDDENEAPVPARRARPVIDEDDEDDDSDRRPARRGAAAPKKKSKLPLVLAGLFGLVVLGGGAVAAVVLSGVFGGPADPKREVVDNAPPADNANAGSPPRAAAVEPPEPTKGPEPAKFAVPAQPAPDSVKPAPATGTEPAKKGPSVVMPLQKTPEAPRAGEAVKSPPPTRTVPDQATMNRVKSAAVFIEVEDNTGKAWGSGWFGMEPNLIFTNAHVMGMLAPGASKPKKITIFVNPGTNQEKVIPHAKLELISVDRFADLAILRVLNETDLPTPLQIRPSSELRDLEPLVVVGYPNGRTPAANNKSTRAPQVTINTTSFSTNRIDDDGNLYSVQIRGGAGPGNSGGPIIDADGNVIAVLVRGPADAVFAASMCYGVPTEFVSGLLAGRVGDIEYGQAYRKGGQVRIPVTCTCMDPFQRLKEVGFACWVGDKEDIKKRSPGAERTGVEPGDSNLQEVKLAYKYAKDKQTATGELVFPELPAGRAYWAQPYYANGLVPKYFMAGKPVKLDGPPVDVEEADLIVRYKPGTRRPVTLTNSSDIDEFEEGEDSKGRIVIETTIRANETVARFADAATGAVNRLNVGFDKLELKANLGEGKEDVTSRAIPKEIRDLLYQNIKLVQGVADVRKDGTIIRTLSDARAAAPPFQPLCKRFSDEAMEALQQASIPLPNERAAPNRSWKGGEKTTRLLVGYVVDEPKAKGGSEEPPEPGRGTATRKGRKVREYKFAEQLEYTYLGTRTRQGTKEAVLKVTGVIRPAAGTATGSSSGLLKGYAYIDLDTGTVLECELHREFEIDSSGDGIKKRISGSNDYKVVRGSAGGR